MSWLKTARLIFCIAALLFVAKPFIGFSLPQHLKSPVKTNIIVKIFSKRKLDTGRNLVSAINQMLLNPIDSLLLRFAFLLSLLFPLAFLIFNESDNQLLGRLRMETEPKALTVANRQFRI